MVVTGHHTIFRRVEGRVLIRLRRVEGPAHCHRRRCLPAGGRTDRENPCMVRFSCQNLSLSLSSRVLKITPKRESRLCFESACALWLLYAIEVGHFCCFQKRQELYFGKCNCILTKRVGIV